MGDVNNKMVFNSSKKTRKLIGVVISLTVLYFLRVINLEQDLPPWGIANYQPMDEGQYATMAINEYKYHSFRPDLQLTDINFDTNAHVRNDLVGNIAVYIGLLVFGNTYYGLRMGSVLFGFLNIVLLVLGLFHFYKKGEKNKFNNIVFLGLVVYSILDFIYFIASRTMETTIYRLFFLLLILNVYLWLEEKNKLRFLIMGILSIVAIFMVYITNVFIFAACLALCTIFLDFKDKTEYYDSMSNYFAGCGVGFVMCDFYYYAAWGTSCVQNTFKIISDFSSNDYYVNTNIWESISSNLKGLLGANINIYNISIITMVLLSVPFLLNIIKKEKNDQICFILLIFICYILQTLVSEDFVIRKFILVYPLLLILLYYTFLRRKNWLGIFNNLGKKQRFMYASYSLAVILLSFYVIGSRLIWSGDDSLNDFHRIDIILIVSISIMEIILIATCITYMLNKRIKENYILTCIISCLVLGIILNQYMTTKYILLNPTFTEKQIMVDLQKDVGDNYLFGGFAIGFSLYNDTKPVTGSYEALNKMVENHEGAYYLDYKLREDSVLDFIMNTSKTTWQVHSSYNRNFSVYGEKKGIGVWKIIEK